VVVRSAAPPPPETVAVLVAARDLPAGTALAGADLRVAEWPADGLPGGGLAAAAGRVLASPLRAGEPVTDARVLGPGLLTGQPAGTVALPIRLADPAAAGVVRAGDRVDVLSSEGPAGSAADGSAARPGYAGGPSGGAERVAYGALVLAVRGVTGATTLAGGAGDPGGGLGGLMGGAAGGPDAAGTDPGGMLVLAVSASEAGRLTAAQISGYLGIAVLPR
jgi:Flp pilus assembly protein CpaB